MESFNLDSLSTGEAAIVGASLGTVLTISLIMGVLLIIAGWKIFEKAGEKGWKILIPIYDVYILFKICKLKNWFWAMLAVSVILSIAMCCNMPPVVEDIYGYHVDLDVDLSKYPIFIAGTIISCVLGIVVDVMVSIRLAKAFGKGVGYALGLIFLPNIFTLILGFGKAKYDAKKLDK